MAEIGRIPLSRPIVGYGRDKVTELVLQEPTGELYLRLGDPVRRLYETTGDRRLEVVLRYDVLRSYIAECSGVDLLHVGQMAPKDLDRAISLITRYFRFDEPSDEGAVLADKVTDPGNG